MFRSALIWLEFVSTYCTYLIHKSKTNHFFRYRIVPIRFHIELELYGFILLMLVRTLLVVQHAQPKNNFALLLRDHLYFQPDVLLEKSVPQKVLNLRPVLLPRPYAALDNVLDLGILHLVEARRFHALMISTESF